jgi:predicted helicase
MVDWPRPEVLIHMTKPNLALVANRQSKETFGVFSANCLTERKIAAVYDASTTFPLYLYPDEQSLDQTRLVNFDPEIRKAVEATATDTARGVPDEVAILDYIYGVLHAPNYRETYKEFLRIDFPRVPYPPSPDVFWDVSVKGTQLRKLHLMEDAAIGPTPYQFTGEGDSSVVKIEFKPLSENKETGVCGAVYINDKQAFQDVPQIAWEFYIGGYQPAQKWLKDRKGRQLSWDDIRHYQKIVKILSETDRIMKTIELPLD